MENFAYLLAQAADVTLEGITVADITLPDAPLIYVNMGFLNMCGYSQDEILGKNCRFLQGEDTDKKNIQGMSEAIKNGERFAKTILNYKKDGTPFWNYLSLSPIFEPGTTKLRYYVGIQSDVTAMKMATEHLSTLAKQLLGG